MLNTNRHIIERINLEATMPEADFSTQQALGGWLRDVACPAIAAACDELLPNDEYLRLEQLEIDLGVFATLDVDLPRDRNLLVDRLIQQLRAALTDHQLNIRHEERLRSPSDANQGARAGGDSSTRGMDPGISYDQKPKPLEGKGDATDEQKTGHLEGNQEWQEERRFEQWLYFLEHGSLPWWGGSFPAPEVWAEFLAETLTTQATALTRLLRLTMYSRVAMRRLAADRRHEAAFARLLAVNPALGKAWQNWIQLGGFLAGELARTITVLPLQPAWVQAGKECWWRMLLFGEESTEKIQRTVAEALARLVANTSANGQREVTDWLVTGSKPKGVNAEGEKIEVLLERLVGTNSSGLSEQEVEHKGDLMELISPEELSDSTLPFNNDTAPASAPENTDQDWWRNTEPKKPEQSTSDTAPEHWYVRHAGLVLVHPFLEPLFTDLGYWQNGAFADELAQQRAVYLTHYLATGNPEGHEEELVLPKLLCGWPVSGAPAALTEPLASTELQEADDLLRAVIGHWPAIGEASPDGLREGFFAREARLLRRENDWELTVERMGQDILLGRLAWGISMVRCAWHEVFIKVDW